MCKLFKFASTCDTGSRIKRLEPRIWYKTKPNFRVLLGYFDCRKVFHVALFAIVNFTAFIPTHDSFGDVLKIQWGVFKIPGDIFLIVLRLLEWIFPLQEGLSLRQGEVFSMTRR